jgi:hypothetical protein
MKLLYWVRIVIIEILRFQIYQLRLLIWKIIAINKIVLQMRRPIEILWVIIIISLMINLERRQLIIVTNIIKNIVFMLLYNSRIFHFMCNCLILILNFKTLVILQLQFDVKLLNQLLELIYLFPFLLVFIHYIFQVFPYLIICKF